MKKIIGICGSFRVGSYNRMLLKNIASSAPEGVEVDIIESIEAPIFNEDSEVGNFPNNISEVVKKIQSADGVIIATPEYNRSIPGGLKNFLDWTSRGDAVKCWDKKIVAIVGASSGNLGTVSAQHDLKKVLLYFGARVIGKPEFYMGQNKSKFGEGGLITDESTRDLINKFWGNYSEILNEKN